MLYSKFIRDIGDRTKTPYRTVEALWKSFERSLNHDVMMEPNKYQNLKKLTGSYYEEVARRVEKDLLKDDNVQVEEPVIEPEVENTETIEVQEMVDTPKVDTPIDEFPKEEELEKFKIEEKKEV